MSADERGYNQLNANLMIYVIYSTSGTGFPQHLYGLSFHSASFCSFPLLLWTYALILDHCFLDSWVTCLDHLVNRQSA